MARGRRLIAGRLLATTSTEPTAKLALDVAELAITSSATPQASSANWATSWRLLLGCPLERNSARTFHSAPREMMSVMTPRLFLLVVTPVFHGVPNQASYPRPKSGKYLIKRIDAGNKMKPTRARTLLSAPIGLASVAIISTMTKSPMAFIQR